MVQNTIEFLPSADYEVLAKGLGTTFWKTLPLLPQDFIEIGY
jgi:hypothetical protein